MARNTATWGMPLRSTKPESKGDTIMTIPSSARVAGNDAEANISIGDILRSRTLELNPVAPPPAV
jgi:hypothetical protein